MNSRTTPGKTHCDLDDDSDGFQGVPRTIWLDLHKSFLKLQMTITCHPRLSGISSHNEADSGRAGMARKKWRNYHMVSFLTRRGCRCIIALCWAAILDSLQRNHITIVPGEIDE